MIDHPAKMLIMAGAVLLIAGLLWYFSAKTGFGSLPGDFKYEGKNVKVYFPLVSMLLLSLVLSLIMWLLRR